jgi:hypothetical protein
LDNTNAERQRRYIARLKAKAAAAEGVTNAKAEAELAALKAENARLKTELERERSKPKTAKPPLPPDEELVRQNKSLKTRVRNLTAELHDMQAWYERLRPERMSFQTMSAISKALHSDYKPSETEREEAFKLFTAWKGDRDRDKARRASSGSK